MYVYINMNNKSNFKQTKKQNIYRYAFIYICSMGYICVHNNESNLSIKMQS